MVSTNSRAKTTTRQHKLSHLEIVWNWRVTAAERVKKSRPGCDAAWRQGIHCEQCLGWWNLAAENDHGKFVVVQQRACLGSVSTVALANFRQLVAWWRARLEWPGCAIQPKVGSEHSHISWAGSRVCTAENAVHSGCEPRATWLPRCVGNFAKHRSCWCNATATTHAALGLIYSKLSIAWGHCVDFHLGVCHSSAARSGSLPQVAPMQHGRQGQGLRPPLPE